MLSQKMGIGYSCRTDELFGQDSMAHKMKSANATRIRWAGRMRRNRMGTANSLSYMENKRAG